MASETFRSRFDKLTEQFQNGTLSAPEFRRQTALLNASYRDTIEKAEKRLHQAAQDLEPDR
jgi:hypothetical protein